MAVRWGFVMPQFGPHAMRATVATNALSTAPTLPRSGNGSGTPERLR